METIYVFLQFEVSKMASECVRHHHFGYTQAQDPTEIALSTINPKSFIHIELITKSDVASKVDHLYSWFLCVVNAE